MLMRHYETLDHRAAFRLQVGQLVVSYKEVECK